MTKRLDKFKDKAEEVRPKLFEDAHKLGADILTNVAMNRWKDESILIEESWENESIIVSSPTSKEDDERIDKTADYMQTTGLPAHEVSEHYESLKRIEQDNPIGFIEGLVQDAQYKIPVAGQILEGTDYLRLTLASIRLNDPDFNWDDKARAETLLERRHRRLKTWTGDTLRQRDENLITDFIQKMAEREERGYTFWGKIGSGLSALPSWMIDIALTRGLYSTGKTATKKLITKWFKNKLIAGTAGWVAGSALRTGGMPHRVFANSMKQSFNRGEGWATSIAYGWGETFIEVSSEEAGRTITGGAKWLAGGVINKMPFGKAFLSELQRVWIKISPDNTAAEFTKRIISKGGYHGLVGEIGEERLATIMHAVANTNTFGLPKGSSISDRLLAGIKQDAQVQNLIAEAAVLSVPGAIKVSIAHLGEYAHKKQLAKAIVEQVGVTPEVADKAVKINGKEGAKAADDYLSQVKTEGQAAAEEEKEVDRAYLDKDIDAIENLLDSERLTPAQYDTVSRIWHEMARQSVQDKRAKKAAAEAEKVKAPPEAKQFVKGFAGRISPEHFKDSELKWMDQKTVDAMVEGYKESNEVLLSRPIAVVPDGEGGISIVEGTHRASAAKKAGVSPPVVVVADSRAELEGMSAPEVDALAKEMYEATPPPPSAKAPPEATEEGGGVDWSTAVRQGLMKSKKKRPTIKRKQKQARKERVGAFMGTLEHFLKKGMPAREAILNATAKLRGPLTEYDVYEPLDNYVTPEFIQNAYLDIGYTEKLRPLEKIVALNAFDKLRTGTYLTPGDAKIIEKWRPELADVAKERVPWASKAWHWFLQAANIPRTMLTMMGDMSGVGRQARALGMSDLKKYGKMIHRTHRAFVSEKYAKQLVKQYESSDFYEEAVDAGLDFSHLGESAEEEFEQPEHYIAAPLLERLPIVGRIVRASERAFTTPINWLRMMIYENARIANPDMSDAKMKGLAQSINDLSGRSSIGRIRAIRSITPLMSAFFSPRFSLSRMKLPYTMARPIFESIKAGEFKKDVKALAMLETRGAFQVVGRSMAMFVVSNIALMTLVKWLWPDDVEIEPDLRSADGGKMKVGNKRVELWAGYLQAAQMYVRTVTGQKKSQSGRLYDVDRRDLVEIFGRSKAAPLPGLFLDLWRGRTFWGEKLFSPPRGPAGEVLTKVGIPENIQGISKETWNRIGPLVAQDFADAAWDSGLPSALAAATLSFYGFGVQTYPVWPTAKLHAARNAAAQEKYQKKWDDLKPKEQVELKRLSSLKAAEAEATEERRKLGPGDWTKYHLKPLEDSAKRMQKRLPDVLRTELELLEMTPGGVKRKIKGDFYLNDKRYTAYETYAVDEIKKRLMRVVESDDWKKMDYITRLQTMQEDITDAKETARLRVLREINRGDL